jgi:phosphopantothenoylcysteine synthetase/decarboxylase
MVSQRLVTSSPTIETMRIVVTCGPSYEPIDAVRRMTNFSTGRLGIALSNAFAAAGHKVFCFKGEQATDPSPLRAEVQLATFSTNDDLAGKLQELHESQGAKIEAVFHAAALADFRVASVENSAGEVLRAKKYPTRGEDLILRLAPTTKVLPLLRDWFSEALIVGWKYEMEGSRDEILGRVFGQIKEARTTACILNGPAYGAGFALCMPQLKSVEHIADLDKLCARLIGWTIDLRKATLPPL